jgi:hypothetical protein
MIEMSCLITITGYPSLLKTPSANILLDLRRCTSIIWGEATTTTPLQGEYENLVLKRHGIVIQFAYVWLSENRTPPLTAVLREAGYVFPRNILTLMARQTVGSSLTSAMSPGTVWMMNVNAGANPSGLPEIAPG